MGQQSHDEKRNRIAMTTEALKRKLKASASRIGGATWPRLWNKGDKDRSGALDLQEFTVLVRQHAKIPVRDLAEKDIDFIFRVIDADRSNTITFGELMKWLDARDVDLSALDTK